MLLAMPLPPMPPISATPDGPDSAASRPTDLEAGLDFLARLPLADPPGAEMQLHTLLDSMPTLGLSPDDLFFLLENAAEPLYFVREAQARHYHGKALHLDADQELHFQRGAGVWLKMVAAYTLCLDQVLAQDEISPGLAQETRVATLLQRGLHYLALSGRDHFLARHQLPEGFWSRAHALYARAEALGLAEIQVERPQAEIEGRSQRCIDAYVSLLLLDLASPYGRSLADFNILWLLADHWSPLVWLKPFADEEPKPLAFVDLDGDQAVQFFAEVVEGKRLRSIDCSALILQMKRCAKDPAQLPQSLGEPDRVRLSSLLPHLLKAWSPRPLGRRFPRSADSGVVEIGIGLEFIHQRVRANQTGFNSSLSTEAREEIGRLVEDGGVSSGPAYAGLLQDHSASGFRLILQPPHCKVSHQQLLALRPHDGIDYLLGQVRWLIQCQDGGVMIGLTVLPGVPTAIAVRPESLGLRRGYLRAFALPAFPAMGEPASLVIPQGIYQTHIQTTLELFDGSHRRITLTGRLQSGADFDRVCYRN